MPYNRFTTGQNPTASFLNANLIDQSIATVTTSGRPTGTEGQFLGVTDTDRLEAYNGSGWTRMGHWSAAGRTGVKLRRVANLSIPNTTDTTITWDTEDFDSDGFIAVSSDSPTVPTGCDGTYDGLLIVTFASNPGAGGNIRFEGNGFTFDARTPTPNSTVGYPLALGVPNIDMAATNILKSRVYQASGGAINITASLILRYKHR